VPCRTCPAPPALLRAAGKDSTFQFLETVLDEVMELFPSKYLHIGGDECPKIRWASCVSCQQRIKAEGLAGEEELQTYFINRMAAHVRKQGRCIIGWDEILEGGIPDGAIVMCWRGTLGGIAAAKHKHHVIMTPNTRCYFDYRQSASLQVCAPLCSTRPHSCACRHALRHQPQCGDSLAC
jgi:hexosaminidase